MKSFIVFALFVAAAVALPATNPADQTATILKSNFDNIGVQGYSFDSETSNGIHHQEEGQLKNVGTEQEALEVRGGFSYILDGVTYAVSYIANEKGFQPQGAHLPVSP